MRPTVITLILAELFTLGAAILEAPLAVVIAFGTMGVASAILAHADIRNNP